MGSHTPQSLIKPLKKIKQNARETFPKIIQHPPPTRNDRPKRNEWSVCTLQSYSYSLLQYSTDECKVII